jgi:hypothetical protein
MSKVFLSILLLFVITDAISAIKTTADYLKFLGNLLPAITILNQK